MNGPMARVVVAVILCIATIIVLACMSGCVAEVETPEVLTEEDGGPEFEATTELGPISGVAPEPESEPEPEPERVCCREDNDRDGYGGDSIWYHVGEYCPVGSSTPCEGVQVDCDDDNHFIHPRAPEICDYLDNNCDGVVDEGCDGMS